MLGKGTSEVLRGCALALDLVLDFGLILDVSPSCSSPRVVYLNGVLADRIGCECRAPGVNEQGTKNVHVQLEYHDHMSSEASNEARAGLIQLATAEKSFSFSFRGNLFESNFMTCILKDVDEVELMQVFFNGCDVMLGIVEGNLETNTWQHIYANKKAMGFSCSNHGSGFPLSQFDQPLQDVVRSKTTVMFEHSTMVNGNLLWGRYYLYYLSNGGSDNRPLVGYVVQVIITILILQFLVKITH